MTSTLANILHLHRLAFAPTLTVYQASGMGRDMSLNARMRCTVNREAYRASVPRMGDTGVPCTHTDTPIISRQAMLYSL